MAGAGLWEKGGALLEGKGLSSVLAGGNGSENQRKGRDYGYRQKAGFTVRGVVIRSEVERIGTGI